MNYNLPLYKNIAYEYDYMEEKSMTMYRIT